MKNKKVWGDSPRKICEGVPWKNMWSSAKKICERGSAKFSIPPPLSISNGIALRVSYGKKYITRVNLPETQFHWQMIICWTAKWQLSSGQIMLNNIQIFTVCFLLRIVIFGAFIVMTLSYMFIVIRMPEWLVCVSMVPITFCLTSVALLFWRKYRIAWLRFIRTCVLNFRVSCAFPL